MARVSEAGPEASTTQKSKKETESETKSDPLSKSVKAAEQQASTMLMTEESCLGYLYPKRVDVSTQGETANYGSNLGRIGQAAEE